MDSYSMPTRGSSGCSLEPEPDWADRLVSDIIGTTNMDRDLERMLRDDFAKALRMERNSAATYAEKWLGPSRPWRKELGDAIRARTETIR